MGKLSKKLIVYLDQNFISEMAKTDIKETVNSQFKSVYELLHRGFLDEKIVVPRSFFHNIETSLVPRLKERITTYQGYLGQIDLNPKEDIYAFQVGQATKEFSGESIDSIDHHVVYHEDPDRRTRMLGVNIDMHLERSDYKSERLITAQHLDQLRKKIISENIGYNEQLKKEFNAQSEYFLKYKPHTAKYYFNRDLKKIIKFANSRYFRRIPMVDIYSRMWTKLLNDFPNRTIKNSDATDVEIISTYLPYVDLLATDSFMTNLVKELRLDKKYQTIIFSSKKEGLKAFEVYLKNYLASTKPVNVPKASIFVLSDDIIKEHSFELFYDLGRMSRNVGHSKEWLDIYGFDDGNMPVYQLKRGPKCPIPFYGLQEVRAIKIQPDAPIPKILKICKEKCRSDKFVIIDSYRKLPNNFVETLIKYCEFSKKQILNYKIYNRENTKIA